MTPKPNYLMIKIAGVIVVVVKLNSIQVKSSAPNFFLDQNPYIFGSLICYQNLYDKKFWAHFFPQIYLTQSFFNPKFWFQSLAINIFFDPKFFWPTFFWMKKKLFFDQISFLTKLYWTKKEFGSKSVFFHSKKFRWKKCLSKNILGQKKCWLQDFGISILG